MKINSEFKLNHNLYPVRYNDRPATKKQFDYVTIWYDEKDPSIRPLVMTDKRVLSSSNWGYKSFYTGICRALETLEDRKHRRSIFNIRFRLGGHYLRYPRKTNHVRWGCRTLNKTQLKSIKKTLEWHFDINKSGK